MILNMKKKKPGTRCQWLMSVILATQEAEITGKSWFQASFDK
jgi:hypothetical protein